MLYNNFPKYLDDILLSFSNDLNRYKSVRQLTGIVFKKEVSKKYDLSKPIENSTMLGNELFTYPSYIRYALEFLHREDYVIFDNTKRDDEESVIITSKGFYKIKTEGFAKKIRNDKRKSHLQFAVWITALITFCITLYGQYNQYFVKKVQPSNISINCTCK
jgi:hypothetical protein